MTSVDKPSRTTAGPDAFPLLVGTCFRYWDSDGDKRWAGWVWTLLAAAGVVPRELDGDGDNVADHALTVLALAYESELFNEVRATGREEWVDPHDPSDIVDFLDDIALGRWAARRDVEQWTFPESRPVLLRQCVELRAQAVMRTLVDEMGGVDALFVSLLEQSFAHAEYPLSVETQRQVLERAGADEQVAYEWLVQRHGRS